MQIPVGCVVRNINIDLFVRSCGGSSSTQTPLNPAPIIQSISPSSAAAGANGLTLTITGANFLSSSAVTWNGKAKLATLVSASQLTIPISSSDLSASGTVQVEVTNPAPGGGQTSTSFTISAPPSSSSTDLDIGFSKYSCPGQRAHNVDGYRQQFCDELGCGVEWRSAFDHVYQQYATHRDNSRF